MGFHLPGHSTPDLGPGPMRKQEGGPGSTAVQLRLWVCIHGFLDSKPSFPQDGGLALPTGGSPSFLGMSCWHSQTVLINNWHSKAVLPGTEQPDRAPLTKLPCLTSPVKT